ncbi:MmgE/PrpD family protein [uncultured Methylobacterium sp.]|uniref:MmgE/PrpD family protein n=1 Tax=uncultured Methylobacterium sp. TaxID=157278 RepID=UPI002590B802|nr:MmgE/PrpD family protein [uncultured Methylobacterium sp.]
MWLPAGGERGLDGPARPSHRSAPPQPEGDRVGSQPSGIRAGLSPTRLARGRAATAYQYIIAVFAERNGTERNAGGDLPLPGVQGLPPATLQLARIFSALTWAEVPEPVRRETERLLLDTLGCLLAGADTEIGPIARKVGLALGGGIPVFVAGGADLGLLGAIYANARLANALDLDETFPVGAHFGVGAVASALGLAEAQKQSGAAFLTAILTGYELGARLASEIGPVIEITDGRVTGFPVIWGVAAPVVLAAAGAAARLLAQDPDTFAQTLGVAGANTPIPAGAHWAAAVDLPNAKYCDAGWCAVTGAGAALAVEAGTTGFPTILDGPSGLARVSGAVSPGVAHLTEGLGERWLIADITYKPWPSCRFTHPVLTALGAILANERPAVDAITAIVVETGPLNGSARFTLATPRTFASRQFSFPHLVAMQLLAVPPGPAWSDPRWVEDPVATALRAKVSFVSHPRGEDFVHSLTRNQMRTLPGGIQLHLADGRVLRAESDTAQGDPWDPGTLLSDEMLAAKVRGLVPGPVEPLIEAVEGLSRAPSVGPLIAALRAAGGRQ